MRRGLLCALAVMAVSPLLYADETPVTLNGLKIGIDRETGSLTYLEFPATGILLKSQPAAAGLLDVAYPTEYFAPMRLAWRFSRARVVRFAEGVTIAWEKLGPSRNYGLPEGAVSAEVRIRSAGDGRSVILSCTIYNLGIGFYAPSEN